MTERRLRHGHHPFAGTNGKDWMKPDLYIDLAQSLERGGFDYILIEDTSMGPCS